MACPYDIHVYISQEFSIVNNILFKTAVHLCGSLFQIYIMWPFIFPNRKIAYTLVNKSMKISTYEYENHHSNPIPQKNGHKPVQFFELSRLMPSGRGSFQLASSPAVPLTPSCHCVSPWPSATLFSGLAHWRPCKTSMFVR